MEVFKREEWNLSKNCDDCQEPHNVSIYFNYGTIDLCDKCFDELSAKVKQTKKKLKRESKRNVK